MIEYRSFHNSDPPKLVSLWHACRLGRGAAEGFTSDAFETFCFSQPYFDPHGLIAACDGPNVMGFVHAGFGTNQEQTGLSHTSGVICAVMVHPDFRGRGIGRELVSRAESYLETAGASCIFAGPASPRDPFYVGLYGGPQPAGFLESDANAAPFFTALGYEPVERHAVYQRGIGQPNPPVSMRLIKLRRKMKLAVPDKGERESWWWVTRFGRLDSIRFCLVPKGDGAPVAGVTVFGLDLYLAKWRQRAIGLVDLFVPEPERRQGYAQALIVEICRKLREELVTAAEAHATETNPAGMRLLESAGFQRIDTGVVYRRPVESGPPNTPPDLG